MAVDITVKVLGVDDLVRKLKKHPDIAMHEIISHMNKEAEGIMTDSKENYVPVDLGTLKSSGHVKLPVVKKSTVVVEMGYGGAASKYALRVHEDLNAKHTVGQAKYLEIPFKKAVSGIITRLRVRLATVVKRL